MNHEAIAHQAQCAPVLTVGGQCVQQSTAARILAPIGSPSSEAVRIASPSHLSCEIDNRATDREPNLLQYLQPMTGWFHLSNSAGVSLPGFEMMALGHRVSNVVKHARPAVLSSLLWKTQFFADFRLHSLHRRT